MPLALKRSHFQGPVPEVGHLERGGERVRLRHGRLLEVLRKADGDHRLALIAGSDYTPQGQRVLSLFPWVTVVYLGQDNLEAPHPVGAPGLACAERSHPKHVPQPTVVALPPGFLRLVGLQPAVQVGGDGGRELESGFASQMAHVHQRTIG